ncbi:MAG TPA: hypothetical protein VHE12_02230 [bacterium]|nr:hypothetical protein [bacterium]
MKIRQLLRWRVLVYLLCFLIFSSLIYVFALPQVLSQGYLWLANRNNATAQFKIGAYFEQGYGFSKDYKTAFEWYLRAARGGYSKAVEKSANLCSQGLADIIVRPNGQIVLGDLLNQTIEIKDDFDVLYFKAEHLEEKIKVKNVWALEKAFDNDVLCFFVKLEDGDYVLCGSEKIDNVVQDLPDAFSLIGDAVRRDILIQSLTTEYKGNVFDLSGLSYQYVMDVIREKGDYDPADFGNNVSFTDDGSMNVVTSATMHHNDDADIRKVNGKIVITYHNYSVDPKTADRGMCCVDWIEEKRVEEIPVHRNTKCDPASYTKELGKMYYYF